MDIRIYNTPEGPIFEEDGDFIVKIMISDKDFDMEELVDIFEEYSCYDESQSLYGKERYLSLCFQTRENAERFIRKKAARRYVIAGCNRLPEENTHKYWDDDSMVYELFLDELLAEGGIKKAIKAVKNATEYVLFVNDTKEDANAIALIGVAIENNVRVHIMPRTPLNKDLDKFDAYINSVSILKEICKNRERM